MQAALSGYLTIWSVIGVGWVVAHFRVLNESHRRMLSRVAFTVASPALLFSLVARANLGHLFSATLAVSTLAIVGGLVVYLVLARVLFGRGDLSGRVVGTLCSVYTNAGNLGLPVAAYVLGDMTWMAPILLLQTAIMQPAALACSTCPRRGRTADGSAGRATSPFPCATRSPWERSPGWPSTSCRSSCRT